MSIDPGKKAEVQKTFFDSLNEIRDVLSRTVANNDQVLNKKIDYLQRFIEAAIYYQMLYLPSLPVEGKKELANVAQERMQWLRQQVKKSEESDG